MNPNIFNDLVNNGFVVTLLIAIFALLYWHAIRKSKRSKS